MLVGVLLLTAGVLLGVALDRVPALADLDTAGLRAVTELRTPWLTDVLLVVTALFEAPLALSVAVLGALGLALRPGRRGDALAVGLLIPVGWLVVMALKTVFDRVRPSAGVVAELVTEPGSAGFPSGHAALATGYAVALCWLLCRSIRWLLPAVVAGVLLVAVVGLSRVYLGVHYPGDVLGGVLVVLGTSALVLAPFSSGRPDP